MAGCWEWGWSGWSAGRAERVEARGRCSKMGLGFLVKFLIFAHRGPLSEPQQRAEQRFAQEAKRSTRRKARIGDAAASVWMQAGNSWGLRVTAGIMPRSRRSLGKPS